MRAATVMLWCLVMSVSPAVSRAVETGDRRSGGGAEASTERDGDVPRAVPGEEEAVKAYFDFLDGSLRSGTLGWWEKEADPVIRLVGTYTGLGSDALTVLSLDRMDKILPRWKAFSGGLEKFAVAYSVYVCLADAASGSVDRAVMTAVKEFLKNRIGKFAAAGPIYAAGMGILDFALDYAGNAAVAQIQDDFYSYYCSYQAAVNGDLDLLFDVLRSGGFDALKGRMDAFWDDPETHGIRGFATLATSDPDYKEHFRSKYLREHLLPRLKEKFEEEEFKARVKARVEALSLLRSLRTTEVRLVLRILDRFSGKGAEGFEGEVFLPGGKRLAGAPVKKGVFEAEFPLLAVFAPGGGRCLEVRVRPRPGVKGKGRTVVLRLDDIRNVRRETLTDTIVLRPSAPVFVERRHTLTIVPKGTPGEPRPVVVLSRLSLARDGSEWNLEGEPPSERLAVELRLADPPEPVSVDVVHGRYLLRCGSVPSGPFVVRGDMEVEAALGIPDAAGVGEGGDVSSLLTAVDAAFSRMMDLLKNGKASFPEAFLELPGEVEEAVVGVEAGAARLRLLAAVLADRMKEVQRRPLTLDEKKAAIEALERKRKQALERAADLERRLVAGIERGRSAVFSFRASAEEELGRAWDEHTEALNEADRITTDLLNAVRRARAEAAGAVAPLFDGSWERAEKKPSERSRKALESLKAAVAEAEDLSARLGRVLETISRLRERIGKRSALLGLPVSLEGLECLDGYRSAVAKVETLWAGNLVDFAEERVEYIELKVERRREADRRTKRLLDELLQAARSLPVASGPEWEAARKGFEERLRRLEGNIASGRGGDGEQWRSLAADLDAFLSSRTSLCGDLRAAGKRTETPYSRYKERYRALYPALRRLAGREWRRELYASARRASSARREYVLPVVRLEEEVAALLALGKDSKEMASAIGRLRAEYGALFDEDGIPVGSEETFRRLEKARAVLDRLPVKFRSGLEEDWEERRDGFVRSGGFREYARSCGGPYVVFREAAERRLEEACVWWPERFPPEGWNERYAVPVKFEVKNAPPGALFVVRYSRNGGKSWRVVRRGRDGLFRIDVPQEPWKGFAPVVDAVFPGGEVLAGRGVIPLLRLPE